MKKIAHSPALRLLCAAALIAASAACNAVPPKRSPVITSAMAPSASSPDAVLSAKITEVIGDAACDSAAQCRTQAIGHKACGGPEGYVAYSSKRTDAAVLAKLAERQAAERKAADTREGMMSTCSVELDPGATCSAGRCILQQRRSNAVELK